MRPTSIAHASADLVAEGLSAFGQVRVRATGASMLPSVWPGDVLTLQACGSRDIEVGDIAAFRREGRLVIHRVRSRDGLALLTRGDALAAHDPPVLPENLLGRVVRSDRRGTSHALAPASHLGLRVARWLLRRSDWTARVMLRLQRRLAA